MPETPPTAIVQLAEHAARESPCLKSRRGAIVYERGDEARASIVLGSGYNGPPSGVNCDGSPECRADCGKRCMHAEARAILNANIGRAKHSNARLELVHVKIDESGKLVAGGPPSCWQCSRLILDLEIGAVWLFQGNHPSFAVPPRWVRWTARGFHAATLQEAGVH